MQLPSFSQSRPRGVCLAGTFNPSLPDALHAIFADSPPGLIQQGKNAPTAITTILTGQSNNCLRQPVFIVVLRRLIALRPAWLL
jgi:hypothetical protein